MSRRVTKRSEFTALASQVVEEPSMASETTLDPVCGMSVSPDAPHQHEHAGIPYRFCSARCLARFREDPPRYLQGAPSPGPAHGSKRGMLLGWRMPGACVTMRTV